MTSKRDGEIMSGGAAGRKVAIVTGAGRGIGRETSIVLSSAGYAVECVDLDGDAAAETAKLVGGRATQLDVCDEVAVAEFVGTLDRCDVLVSNAGIWRFTPLLETPISEAIDVLRVNVIAPLIWIKSVAPLMAAGGGGSIVHLASTAARAIATATGVYPSSKAAVIALTEQAAVELGPLGIRVNTSPAKSFGSMADSPSQRTSSCESRGISRIRRLVSRSRRQFPRAVRVAIPSPVRS
ncbi:MAG: SDR family oxidoreductase [Actinobacteria bacterium]|nr:SDR family oxidoreductase [Actinomycetota bacterium]